MTERKHYLEGTTIIHRTALMFEPHVDYDMFGAFVVEPLAIRKLISAYSSWMVARYLNMCGHCTIGVITAILEGSLIEMKRTSRLRLF